MFVFLWGIDYFLGTEGHGFFKKARLGCAMLFGALFVFLLYRSIYTALFAQGMRMPLEAWASRQRSAYKANQAVNLRKQAVITKCRIKELKN